MKEVMPPSQKRNIFISIILIVTLGFAVYSNSLNGQFIWDDEHLIKNNVNIKKWSNLPRFFTEDIGARAGREYNFYRPVQMITYRLDYFLWKLDVRGYHLTNIVLHILVALCIYFLVNVLFGDRLLSALTGILYVVHPIHTEAVTYISGRADSLALLFMLLCFLIYIRSFSIKNLGMYILMLLSYVIALLSKENSLILPALLLLYHYSFKKKIKVKEFLSIVSLAILYMALRMTVLKDLMAGGSYGTTLPERLPGFFVAFTNYVKLLFLPLNLHMEYGRTLFEWRDPKAVLGAVMLIGILIYAFRKKEKGFLVFFSISWFLIALLPVSNLYAINAYMAEHWLYLPSIGFFLIMAKTICVGAYCNTPLHKILTVILAIGLIGFYSYLTVKQNMYWREPVSFFERTLKYAPDSSDVYYNLGTTYVDINRKEEAIEAFKKAIEINPNYALVYNNLGNVYNEMNRREEAIGSYKKAVRINPRFAMAYNNLGIVYHAVNNREEAIAAYKKAIKIEADNAEAHNNLGVAYAAMNRREDAIAAYNEAVKLKPDYANAYYSLGNVYKAMGEQEKAIASYKEAIRINNNDAEAHNNLALIYFEQKQYTSAIEYYDKARNLGFHDPALFEALKPYR